MTNIARSIAKQLNQLAYKIYSPNGEHKIITNIENKSFIHQIMLYAKNNELLGGEWLQLQQGKINLREQRNKLFYGWGYVYRLENIHKMLVDALGSDFELNNPVHIFGGDKMDVVYPSNTYCMALTKKQIAKKELRFVPCFSFVNWRQAKIDSYKDAVNEISEKGKQTPQDERIFWLGNPEEGDALIIRHHLLTFGKEHNFCNFIDSGENHVFLDGRDKNSKAFISMADQTENKYLLDVEGWGYSGRLKFLLFSRRPVFVVERPWNEFWFEKCKPWEHFIPVKKDFSDLEKNWKKVEESKDLYQQIAGGALNFAREFLSYEAAMDYIRDNFDR